MKCSTLTSYEHARRANPQNTGATDVRGFAGLPVADRKLIGFVSRRELHRRRSILLWLNILARFGGRRPSSVPWGREFRGRLPPLGSRAYSRSMTAKTESSITDSQTWPSESNEYE